MAEAYRLEFSRDAQANLDRLETHIGRRILKKLDWLAANAAGYHHYALSGPWSGHYRLRVGDYRIIYTVDHNGLLIVVVEVGHRRDVYDE